MTLVIPPGFADLAYEIRNDGDPDPWYVTCGIDLGDTDNIPALGIALLGGFTTIMDLLNGSSQNTAVKITVGQDGASPVRYTIPRVGPGGVGGSGSAKLPQNCAALVRKNTALGGRQHRGRLFLPNVLDEGEVSHVGLIAAPMMTALTTKVDLWFDTFEDTPMVILHNNVGVGDTPDPTPVTSLTCDNVVSTQRRRLR
jgi:hypothetical protein